MDRKLEFADSLVEEGLTEAAESFFGRRTSLEKEMDFFFQKVELLKAKQTEVEGHHALLHYILDHGDEEIVRSFYTAIGLKDESLYSVQEDIEPKWEEAQIPFGLTGKARYQKLVIKSYQEFSRRAAAYMFGEYVNDANNPQKKVKTIHYDYLRRWCDDINERIEKINTYSCTSDILQFSKKMDVQATEKERLMDAGIEYDLDKDMCFTKITFSNLGLRSYPEMPADKSVVKTVKKFSGELYQKRTAQIQDIIKKIR